MLKDQYRDTKIHFWYLNAVIEYQKFSSVIKHPSIRKMSTENNTGIRDGKNSAIHCNFLTRGKFSSVKYSTLHFALTPTKE